MSVRPLGAARETRRAHASAAEGTRCDLAHFRDHLRAVRWIEAQELDEWECVLALEYLRDSYCKVGVPAGARAALVRAHACALLAIKVDGVWPFPEWVFGVRHARPEPPEFCAAPAQPPVRDEDVAAVERKLFETMRHILLRDSMSRKSACFGWYTALLRLPHGAGPPAALRRAAVDMQRRRRPTGVPADWVARVFGASSDIAVPFLFQLRECLAWLKVGAAVEYLVSEQVASEGYVRATVEEIEFDGRTFSAAVWLGDGASARLRWTTADRLRAAPPGSDSRALRLLD